MNFNRTFLWNGFAIGIKTISGFLINKIVAVYIGPGGMALIGNFQSFLSMVLTFSNGAIQKGVIKYVAEYRESESQLKKLLSTAFIITLVSAVITGLLMIIFGGFLSTKLLNTLEYRHIFTLFGFTVILFALNTLLIGVLNGIKSFGKYIVINIVSSLFNLALIAILVIRWELTGALITLVVNQSLVFFITLIFVVRSPWFSIGHWFSGWDNAMFRKLMQFSAMAVASAVTVPVSHILVRKLLEKQIDLDAAGVWQGLWKISDYYLLLITTSISLYFLPRLSEVKTSNLIRKELWNGYRIVIPATIVMGIGIYLLREPVIRLLFTDEFLPMESMFIYQLPGDVLKVIYWMLSILLIARSMTTWYIITEFAYSACFVILVYVFVGQFGLEGAAMAHLVNFSVNAVFILLILRNVIFGKAS